MGVFSSSAPAPQKEEPQCAPVEPAEKTEPETGEGRVWHRGVLGRRREGGGGTALNVCRAGGLKSSLHPGDQCVSYPCVSLARKMSFKKWNLKVVGEA